MTPNRGEIFRQGVQAFRRVLQQRKDVKRYVQGYIGHPERAEEVGVICLISYAALAAEPWN